VSNIKQRLSNKFKSIVDVVALNCDVIFKQMRDDPNIHARTVINIPDNNFKIGSETFDFIEQIYFRGNMIIYF
jgi:hypothetical protein